LLAGTIEILALELAGMVVFEGGSALIDIMDSLAEEEIDAVDDDMDVMLRLSDADEELAAESDSKESARVGVVVSVGAVHQVLVGVGENVVGLAVATPPGG
jgi:hypothetical protein